MSGAPLALETKATRGVVTSNSCRCHHAQKVAFTVSLKGKGPLLGTSLFRRSGLCTQVARGFRQRLSWLASRRFPDQNRARLRWTPNKPEEAPIGGRREDFLGCSLYDWWNTFAYKSKAPPLPPSLNDTVAGSPKS